MLLPLPIGGFSSFSFQSSLTDAWLPRVRRGAEQNLSLEKVVATSNFGLVTDKPVYYAVFRPVNLL